MLAHHGATEKNGPDMFPKSQGIFRIARYTILYETLTPTLELIITDDSN